MARKKSSQSAKPKNKTAKPKAKPPARKAEAGRSSNNRPRPVESAQFYFPSANFDPRLIDHKPTAFSSVSQCRSFDEARDQAIDALIEIIDRCEQRLWQLKRARSYAEYEQMGSGDKARPNGEAGAQASKKA